MVIADDRQCYLPSASRSGRRDLNSRRPAWKAGALPLSYSRWHTIPINLCYYTTICTSVQARPRGVTGCGTVAPRVNMPKTQSISLCPLHTSPERLSQMRNAPSVHPTQKTILWYNKDNGVKSCWLPATTWEKWSRNKGSPKMRLEGKRRGGWGVGL
jgi:hypothetical protein